MNENLLDSFVNFTLNEYSRSHLSLYPARKAAQIIRQEDPNTIVALQRLDSLMGKGGRFTPYSLQMIFPQIPPTRLAQVLVKTIQKPFSRVWNRCVDPASMLYVWRQWSLSLNDRSLDKTYANYLTRSIWIEELARLLGSDDRRVRDAAERDIYEADVNDNVGVANDVMRYLAGVTDELGERVKMPESERRARIYRVGKELCDEIREQLPKPDVRDVFPR